MQSLQTDDNHSDERFLIVGLGNPGRKYRRNRHNVGFMVIDNLAERNDIEMGRVKHKAIIGEGRLSSSRIVLAKPQTFMNLSGNSGFELVNFYGIGLNNVLIIYDEIDLPFGTIRLREKGGSGGHNGMKSIISRLGRGFSRLRLGVGRPPGRMDPADYVLKDFPAPELPILDDMIDLSMSAVETFITSGIDVAMTMHNGPVNEQ